MNPYPLIWVSRLVQYYLHDRFLSQGGTMIHRLFLLAEESLSLSCDRTDDLRQPSMGSCQ